MMLLRAEFHQVYSTLALGATGQVLLDEFIIWKANLATLAGTSDAINLSGSRNSFRWFEEEKLSLPNSFYRKRNIWSGSG